MHRDSTANMAINNVMRYERGKMRNQKKEKRIIDWQKKQQNSGKKIL